jgi:hypothetical protein
MYPCIVGDVTFPLAEHILDSHDGGGADVQEGPANQRDSLIAGQGVWQIEGRMIIVHTEHSMLHSCARMELKHRRVHNSLESNLG